MIISPNFGVKNIQKCLSCHQHFRKSQGNPVDSFSPFLPPIISHLFFSQKVCVVVIVPDLAKTAPNKNTHTHTQNITITQKTQSNYPLDWKKLTRHPQKGPFQKERILFQPPFLKRYAVSFLGGGAVQLSHDQRSHDQLTISIHNLKLHKSQEYFKMHNLNFTNFPTKCTTWPVPSLTWNVQRQQNGDPMVVHRARAVPFVPLPKRPLTLRRPWQSVGLNMSMISKNIWCVSIYVYKLVNT